MLPVIIKLPDFTEGDTWEALSIGPVLFNGIQSDAALQSCSLYFRSAPDDVFVYGLKSDPTLGYGTIYINDAATWAVTIPMQDVPLLVAGDYAWGFRTVDADGIVRMLYKGTLHVEPGPSNE